MTDDEHKQILHQLGAKLQESENKNPIKLHKLGAEIISNDKISDILENNGMLPIFGIVPWKHHLVITSKCKSIKEAFYYIKRIIDEGISKRELEDIIEADDYSKYGPCYNKLFDPIASTTKSACNECSERPLSSGFPHIGTRLQ